VKKGKLKCFVSQIVIALTIITISGCEKNHTNNYNTFLGTWISTDLADTIEFTSDHDLYKMFSGVNDHYDYSLSRDSILIQYNGMYIPFIYIGIPKNHFYKLNGDELTIDFRPYCYGFYSQVIRFLKK
jgi:hypothetical protein